MQLQSPRSSAQPGYLAVPSLDHLEARFDDAMIALPKEIREKCGYTAALLYRMLAERNGLAAARALLSAPSPSTGFTTLFLRGRLDLTVEALVVRAPWKQLFSPEELSVAHQRLAACGYGSALVAEVVA
jgi:hypothetical protein